MELVEYIKEARKAGTDDIKIRDELVRAGWNIVDIEEAFNYREQPVPAPTPERKLEPRTEFKFKIIPEARHELKIKKPKVVYPPPTKLTLVLVVVLGCIGGYFLAAYGYTVFYDLPMWPFNAQSIYY